MEKEDKVQGEKALKIKSLKSTKQKRKKKVQGCFIHFANVKDRSITVMTESSFQKIKAAAEVRQSQDSENRLDNICSNIPSHLCQPNMDTIGLVINVLRMCPEL